MIISLNTQQQIWQLIMERINLFFEWINKRWHGKEDHGDSKKGVLVSWDGFKNCLRQVHIDHSWHTLSQENSTMAFLLTLASK